MADNFAFTPGVGGTGAADDVGGVLYPRVKLDIGTDGVTTPVLGGTGVMAAGVQRVTLASDDPAVVDLAAIEVLQTTIAGDTTSIDGKITACNTGAVVLSSGTVTTVSTVTNLSQLGGVAISMNEGVVGTGVQRVTIATDDDSVAHLATIAGDTTSLDGKVTACNTGAVVVSSGTITAVTAISNALPAGTNAIGKLAANSGVDIGDVDVLSIAAGDNNIGNVDIVTVPAPLSVVGGGTEAAAMRVTIANDSTGVITVDGTVTAELSATDNAVLDTIDTALDAINAKLVTGTVIGDVNLGATDNAVLDSIVTNTNRAAITGYGQAKLDSADVTTAQVLVAAVADKKFYITSLILSVAAAGSYWIEDDDAAQITCKYTLAANGGLAISFPIDTPYKSTTVNKGLKVKGSVAGVIGCQITYYTLA